MSILVMLALGVGIGVLYLRGDLQAVIGVGGAIDGAEEGQEAATPELVAELRLEIAQLQTTIEDLRSQNDSLAGNPTHLLAGLVDENAPTDAATGQNTLALWNGVRQVLAEEQSYLASSAGRLATGEPLELVEVRAQASNQTAGRLRTLAVSGADPALVKYIDNLSAWNQTGGSLFTQAAILMRKLGSDAQNGSFGEKWAAEEARHRESQARLVRQGDALGDYFQTKYGREFAPLR
jgi:hypothetical protein